MSSRLRLRETLETPKDAFSTAPPTIKRENGARWGQNLDLRPNPANATVRLPEPAQLARSAPVYVSKQQRSTRRYEILNAVNNTQAIADMQNRDVLPDYLVPRIKTRTKHQQDALSMSNALAKGRDMHGFHANAFVQHFGVKNTQPAKADERDRLRYLSMLASREAYDKLNGVEQAKKKPSKKTVKNEIQDGAVSTEEVMGAETPPEPSIPQVEPLKSTPEAIIQEVDEAIANAEEVIAEVENSVMVIDFGDPTPNLH